MHFVGRPRCIPNDSSDKSRRCKVQDFQLEFFHHRFSNILNDTERKMESISDAIAMKYILSVKLQLVLSKSTHQLIGFLVDIHQAISIFDVSCTKTLKDEATIFGLFVPEFASIIVGPPSVERFAMPISAISRSCWTTFVDIKSSRTIRPHFSPFTVHPGTNSLFDLAQEMYSCR